jgi:hypothetical protein
MTRGLSNESASVASDSTDDMVAFAVALDGVDLLQGDVGGGVRHGHGGGAVNGEALDQARRERAVAASKQLLKMEHEIMCLRQRLYGENLHFGGSSASGSEAVSAPDPSGALQSEVDRLKIDLAVASAAAAEHEAKVAGMSEEMSVLRAECGEARQQAAALDASLRSVETKNEARAMAESRQGAAAAAAARERAVSSEEKSNDIDSHMGGSGSGWLGSGSGSGSGGGRRSPSAREEQLGLQLAMATSKGEESEGEIRRLLAAATAREDEVQRLLAREREKEVAITAYVHNATHFEEEIQKAESRLAGERDAVERCKRVIGSTMDNLNGFLRIQGVTELNLEVVRWNPSRVHAASSSSSSSPSSKPPPSSLEQLEGLPGQVEGRLNEVLDKKMEGSHFDAIKYRSLKIQDVALFLPVQAQDPGAWNYHAFVVHT